MRLSFISILLSSAAFFTDVHASIPPPPPPPFAGRINADNSGINSIGSTRDMGGGDRITNSNVNTSINNIGDPRRSRKPPPAPPAPPFTPPLPVNVDQQSQPQLPLQSNDAAVPVPVPVLLELHPAVPSSSSNEEYSEQIMTRQETEQFIQNFDVNNYKSNNGYKSKKVPPPPSQLQSKSQSQSQPPYEAKEQVTSSPMSNSNWNSFGNTHGNQNDPPPSAITTSAANARTTGTKDEFIPKPPSRQNFLNGINDMHRNSHGQKLDHDNGEKMDMNSLPEKNYQKNHENVSEETHAYSNEREAEQWIVPKQMQFKSQNQQPDRQQPNRQQQQIETTQRLHQPPPRSFSPPPNGANQEYNINSRDSPEQTRAFAPRPLPPQSRLAQQQQRAQQQQQQQQQQHFPRDYDYHRGPPGPPGQRYPQSQSQSQAQLQPYSQQQGEPPTQQQRGPPPGNGALVLRQPQHPPPTTAQSLLQRFGKSIDAFSDVDTILAQKAQSLFQSVSSSSDTLTSSVSGVMRKSVFKSLDGVTSIKENIKDRVKGGMGMFGGAPTLATETRDEWEDDRRKTVTEDRRKAILGGGGGDRWSASGSGETFKGSGDSPLQQHLFGLAQELEEESVNGNVNGNGNVNVKVGDNVNVRGNAGNADPRAVVDVVNRGDGTGEVRVRDRRMEYMELDNGPLSTEGDHGEDAQQMNANPYAMLAYPTSASEGLDEDDSSDIEDYDDVNAVDVDAGVDPATYFIASPASQDRPRPRPSSPASFDFDDGRGRSMIQKVGGLFKLPTLKIPKFGKTGFKNYDDSAWDDDAWGTAPSASKSKRMAAVKSKPMPNPKSPLVRPTSARMNVRSPVGDLLDRFSTASAVAKKSTANLLSTRDISRLGHLGRSKALIDVMTITFLYIIVQELLRAFSGTFGMLQWALPKNIDDANMFWRQIYSAINISDVKLSESWAPFAMVACILSVISGNVFVQPKVDKITKALSKTIESSVLQSQLFLRVVAGIPLRHDLMQTFATAVVGQGMATIEIARLRTFVLVTISALLAASIAVIKPICSSIFFAIVDIVSYEGLRVWPVEWSDLGEVVKDIVMTQVQSLGSLIENELDVLMANPMAIFSTASVVAALFIFSQLSNLECGKSKNAARKGYIAHSARSRKDQEIKIRERISNAGVSSASRIGLQMQEGGVQNALSKINSMEHGLNSMPTKHRNLASPLLIRQLAYVTICGALALAPLVVHLFISVLNDKAVDIGNFSGIALVLLFAFTLAKKALFTTMDTSRDLSKVAPFLEVLSNTAQEVEASKSQATRMPSAPSPNKGLAVSDLWAAHNSKKSWACRGVNLVCKPGEVVLVLGEESSGKTKLLTAIGETLASPPKRAKTTTLARGSIKVGGVESQKWNSLELKRKVGIMLSDVRTLSDMSQLHSGMRLKDVLRPTCPRGTHNEVAIDSAIGIATQLTGLSSALSRLPLKLDTIVTANEDELGPSHPNTVALSASEWSKVMLTKVISEALLTNDNPMAAPNNISKSLVGSILLLDDAASHLSEVAETKLIKSLKSSGAATLMTSKRWAIGRFATRVLVMKDGSIVESGTHSELISRGSDHSVYAAHWAEMMSS